MTQGSNSPAWPLLVLTETRLTLPELGGTAALGRTSKRQGGITVANRGLMAAGFAAVMLLVSGCSNCKGSPSCRPRGTYIDANELLGATSATVCFDDDCQVLKPGDGEGNTTTGFYRADWTDGRELMLTIVVFNTWGDTLGSISEERRMDSAGCSCGVFFYDWKDGVLNRLN